MVRVVRMPSSVTDTEPVGTAAETSHSLPAFSLVYATAQWWVSVAVGDLYPPYNEHALLATA